MGEIYYIHMYVEMYVQIYVRTRCVPKMKWIFLHTYTYAIGHYKPSVRFMDLVSHTTYVVCVIFIHKWRDLQFKVDSERQLFWETFNGNFIYSQSFWQKSAERKSNRRNTFRILFWYLAWDLNRGFSSNKPTHYLLDHGDFLYSFQTNCHRVTYSSRTV